MSDMPKKDDREYRTAVLGTCWMDISEFQLQFCPLGAG